MGFQRRKQSHWGEWKHRLTVSLTRRRIFSNRTVTFTVPIFWSKCVFSSKDVSNQIVELNLLWTEAQREFTGRCSHSLNINLWNLVLLTRWWNFVQTARTSYWETVTSVEHIPVSFCSATTTLNDVFHTQNNWRSSSTCSTCCLTERNMWTKRKTIWYELQKKKKTLKFAATNKNSNPWQIQVSLQMVCEQRETKIKKELKKAAKVSAGHNSRNSRFVACVVRK